MGECSAPAPNFQIQFWSKNLFVSFLSYFISVSISFPILLICFFSFSFLLLRITKASGNLVCCFSSPRLLYSSFVWCLLFALLFCCYIKADEEIIDRRQLHVLVSSFLDVLLAERFKYRSLLHTHYFEVKFVLKLKCQLR